MKTGLLLWLNLIVILGLQSCTVEVNENPYYTNGVSLPQLIEGYDLWYVSLDETTGTGDVPFLTRAFTISFINGTLYANNNLAGIGNTGNGYGVVLGYYNYGSHSIACYHNLYGYYNLEVYQLTTNHIRLYDPVQNTSYHLYGYYKNTFNYNQLFFDNLQYFLQEYKAWEKVYTSVQGNPNVFDNENYLRFIPQNNTFQSSKDPLGISTNAIYWDYTGNYQVSHVTSTVKRLKLYYANSETETFDLSIINDGRIQLYHLSSGTTYQFQGKSFIPFMRSKK